MAGIVVMRAGVAGMPARGAAAAGRPFPQLIAWLLLLAAAAGHADDRRLERSRAIASEFQQDLGGELKAAMAAGGPVQAIEVCADMAPQIAARFSAETGADVGRTALRVRNPDNAPDAGARAVLEDFADRVAAGARMPIEHFAPRQQGGMRYMSAIVLQQLCATCHGATLAPAVADTVAERYPDDAATGFAVGELRGAFLIDWPAEPVP